MELKLLRLNLQKKVERQLCIKYNQEIEKSILGEGNLIFCCMGSQESYFRSVGQQNNNNNPKF